jgi:ATP-dependent exoDNAse (exonuclease V) beta subunit
MDTELTPRVYHRLDYHSDHPSEAQQRMVAPSGLKGRADTVNIVYRSEQFIKIASGKLHGRAYSEVGDCIHNVFAAIEHLDQGEVEQLIRSHAMDDVLPEASEVIRSWDNLQGFLCKEFGKPLAEFHERPFRYLLENGTIVNGSIDYVYRTANGDVLIDFKTFPQVEAVTDPTSEHYAGLYAGQLDAYTDALEAAGEKVIKRLIYYPVSGLLCEIGRSDA